MERAANEKEFLALIKRYRSITIEELEYECSKVEFPDDIRGAFILASMTGFGATDTCTLCRAAEFKSRKATCLSACEFCVYSIVFFGETDRHLKTECCHDMSCQDLDYDEEDPDDIAQITYSAIWEAGDAEYIHRAINARADFMEDIWNRYQALLAKGGINGT